ncbi:MAG: hypothetical protein ABJQ69_03605 [Ekhidna sp.]
MKDKIRRSRFAQKRIDYIIYGNPKGARHLIEEFGYEAPKNLHELVGVFHQLIRRKGRKAIKELIKLHPDRSAILKLEKIKDDSYCASCSSYSYNTEDNYCGGCGHSHYDGSGDKASFLEQLAEKSIKELETYYEKILQKANKTPLDKVLADEVQLTFQQLLKRKKETTDQPAETHEPQPGRFVIMHHEGVLILGLTLVAGIIVGTSFKKLNHG